MSDKKHQTKKKRAGLDEKERSQLLKFLSIPHLLEVQARDKRGMTAIEGIDRAPLTFDSLYAHVRNTISDLNSMGIGRNDRVAIVLPNGPEMAVIFLTVSSGATSAPLNPAYRAKEFDFYLSDLNAKALIVQAGMDSPARSIAQSQSIPIIELSPTLEVEAGLFTLAGEKNPPPDLGGFAQPEDVALVLHTSGTTSRPKIVPLTHTNVCTSATNIRKTLKLSEGDRCLNVMPLFHIHGLMGAILSSLTAGTSIVCAQGFYAPHFYEWLEKFRPNWYSAVPTMHQAILARAADNKGIIDLCPLRFIRSSSSSLPPQVMADLESVFKCPVIESYGMTEASHQMASNQLPPGKRKSGSVGIAAGPEIAIMDETGNLLPQGETGEIVISGPNVTESYENNPEANAKAFTHGWFRTGDQGMMDTEGFLYIKDRLKEIINRGGEKISPREVDEVIMDHPAVAQVVTFAAPHTKLGEEVAAAVVLRPKESASEPEIQEFVGERLAYFKVPRRVLIIDEIPKGPTGKLQRVGLAEKLGLTALDPQPIEKKAEYVQPRNSLEEGLTQIWSQVLKVERIGIQDNFFQLGGDSMLAARLFAQIHKTFGQNLPLSTLFHAPTIKQLAKVVNQKDESEALPSLVPIQPAGSNPPLFFVHECYGEVFIFSELAHHLSEEQPFFGLRAQGLDGKQSAYDRIEDMAAHYNKEMLTQNPDGPYHLGGAGVGGMVAFEMAQQLKAQGKKVGLVAMLDTAPPRPVPSDLHPSRSQKSLIHYIRLFFQLIQNKHRFHILKNTIKKKYERFNLRFKPRPIREVWHAIDRAPWKYKPKIYPGQITYFLAEKRNGISDSREKLIGKWFDLANNRVDVYEIPGDHLDMLREPQVKVLARHLKALLEKTQ